MYNVIGDIAGNHKTLMALIKKMPKGKIISVGDIVDRGPSSRRVIEYFMDNQDTTQVLMGNHEHMMIDYYRKVCSHEFSHQREYGGSTWTSNGGRDTMKEFANKNPS